MRKESISQTVPINWMSIAIEACGLIRETMKRANVTRLVNMDEMFWNFYPKETHLIAPVNSKRVGTNRAEDAKKGCTIGVSCELFESEVLAPFVIMDGTNDGYLARRYSNWDGPAAVTFQAKHWMDNIKAIQYLDWLASCYPDHRIGLIWDFAAAHKSVQVLDHAATLGVTLGYIPAGLTSILQVCDLVLNKPLKQGFKKLYCAWKIRSDPGAGGKYNVPRDDVIHWMEDYVANINATQGSTQRVAPAFKSYGQDFRQDSGEDFAKHLGTFEDISIYASLLQNQSAVDSD